MKFKTTFAFLVLATATQALALDYSTSGQFRLRTLNKDYYATDNDLRNVTQMRARLNVDVAVNSQLSLHVSPQAVKDFGEVISATNDETDTARNSSGDKYSTGIDIFEAYADGKRGDVSYRLGRQQLAYGDNILLGTRNWVPGGQSFDAFKLTLPVSSFKLDLVYSQTSEGTKEATTKDDANLSFAYLKMLSRADANLDFYIIHNQKRTVSETISYGFRFKKKFGAHLFATENLLQENHASESSVQHGINALYEITFAESNQFFIGYAQSSESYDQLYTNRHAYNGIADVVGRKNLETFNAGFKSKFSDFNLRLEYLFFRQQQTGIGAYNQATSAKISGDFSEKNIGQEVDFIGNYKLSPNENIQLGAAQFYNGDYFASKGTTTLLYLEYLLQF